MSEHQIDPKVVRYREEYRKNNIIKFYNGWAHLAFTSIVTIIGVVFCFQQVEAAQNWEWWALPAAFLYANFAEYWGHRGPMHKPYKGLKIIYQRHSAEHHRFFTHKDMAFESSRDFQAVLFPAIMALFFIGCFAVPFWVLLAFIVTSNFAWLAVAGGLIYFLNYEWLHFAYHCDEDSWIGRLPGMAKLRWLHQVHHNQALMAHYNFNITYPIWDLVFGTLYREKQDEAKAINNDVEGVESH
jgi:sterol desaturase/sphingolipid hydroxylase (fatty acid hydroxylase superfamily)